MGDIDGLMKSSIVAALALLAVAVAGCGHPAPAPKPVATVADACAAARAYFTYRNTTARTVVVFPQTILAVGAAPSGSPGLGKTRTGKFPRLGIPTEDVVFALPPDCLTGLPRKPAEPGSLEQQFATDYATLPALSEEGSEAVILANERCDDSRCLVGEWAFLRKDSAGVWAVVRVSQAWIS